MASKRSIDKDEIGIKIDAKKYRDMIGFLLYLTSSRQDVMCSVVYVCVLEIKFP